MIQLKVFYNISFPEDRCELITADENEVSTFDDLMRIVRNKLECLQFIPNEHEKTHRACTVSIPESSIQFLIILL